MSFRKFGGINRAAKNNIIRNNVSTSGTLLVTTQIGEPDSLINVDSELVVNNNVKIAGNTDISGNEIVGGNITVEGNGMIKGMLIVEGNEIIAGSLIVDENEIIAGSLIVEGNGSVEGSLTVSGETVVRNMIVNGNETVAGSLTVSGETVAGNMIVNGNETITGSLTVSGETVAGNMIVNGNETVAGSLTVYAANLTSPYITSNPDGVVPKSYVDTLASGLKPFGPCYCTTTGYIDLTQSVTDTSANLDYQLIPGSASRILLKNQANGLDTSSNIENGIYIADLSGNSLTNPKYNSWYRDSDMNIGTNVTAATTVILYGNNYDKNQFVQVIGNADNPAIVGTTPLEWIVFNVVKFDLGPGLTYTGPTTNTIQVDTGNGLDFSGNQLQVDTGNGLDFSGNQLRVKSTLNIENINLSGGINVVDKSKINCIQVSNTIDDRITFHNYTYSSMYNGYNYYVFTTNDNSGAFISTADISINILLVGGGCSGGLGSNTSGGGGGGSVINSTLSISKDNIYNVNVGSGGVPTNSSGIQNGVPGENTYIMNNQTGTDISIANGGSYPGNGGYGYDGINPGNGTDVSNDPNIPYYNGSTLIFGASPLYYGAGGGGVVYYNLTGGTGGTIYGGGQNGGSSSLQPTPGQNYIGAGGGGGGSNESVNSYQGGSGIAIIWVPLKGLLNVSGDANISLTCSAANFVNTSDYRIKTNVELLNKDYIIDLLTPIKYTNTKLNKTDFGLIAHELQEIYPELVSGEKDGVELQTINYTGLIPILINEIKQLKSNYNTLKERLENKNDSK